MYGVKVIRARRCVLSRACCPCSFQVLNQRYDIVFYYFSNITTVPGSAGQVGWYPPLSMRTCLCPADACLSVRQEAWKQGWAVQDDKVEPRQ